MADIPHPTRISMPATTKRGDIIDIKTLIQHEMETGYRRDANGRVIPRDIVARFEVRYLDQIIFAADTFAGVSANPYFAFSTIAGDSGSLTFTWTDLAGRKTVETRSLTVT